MAGTVPVRDLWQMASVLQFFSSFSGLTNMEFQPEELESALEDTASTPAELLQNATKRLLELYLNRKKPIERSAIATQLKLVVDTNASDVASMLGTDALDRGVADFFSWPAADKAKLLYLLVCLALESSDLLRQHINEAPEASALLRVSAVGEDAKAARYYQLGPDSTRLYRQASATAWEVVATTPEDLEHFLETSLLSKTNRKERLLRAFLEDEVLPGSRDRRRKLELQAKRLKRIANNLTGRYSEPLVIEGSRRSRQPVNYASWFDDDAAFERSIDEYNDKRPARQTARSAAAAPAPPPPRSERYASRRRAADERESSEEIVVESDADDVNAVEAAAAEDDGESAYEASDDEAAQQSGSSSSSSEEEEDVRRPTRSGAKRRHISDDEETDGSAEDTPSEADLHQEESDEDDFEA